MQVSNHSPSAICSVHTDTLWVEAAVAWQGLITDGAIKTILASIQTSSELLTTIII